jgi:hypothetical protein
MIAMNGILLHLMTVVKLLLGLFKFLHLQITFNLLFITVGFLFCLCSQRRQFNPITKICRCIKQGEMSVIAKPNLFHRPIKIPPPAQDRQYYV